MANTSLRTHAAVARAYLALARLSCVHCCNKKCTTHKCKITPATSH